MEMKTILFLALCLTLTVVCRAEEAEEEVSDNDVPVDGEHGGPHDGGHDGPHDGGHDGPHDGGHDGHHGGGHGGHHGGGHGGHHGGGHGGHHGGFGKKMKEEIQVVICDPDKADDAMLTELKKCYPHKGGHGHGGGHGGGRGGKHGNRMKKFNEIMETCKQKYPDELTKFTNVKDPENQKSLLFHCKSKLSADFGDCLKEQRKAMKGEGHEGGGHGHGKGGHGKGGHGKGGHGKGGKEITDEQKKKRANKFKKMGCCAKKAVKIDAPECNE